MSELTVQKFHQPVINGDLQASSDRTFWANALFPCIAGSGACFIAGLSVSALSALHLITRSRFIAYSAIGLLFAAFVLMFLAAHCMDRRDAAEKIERMAEAERSGLNR
jgi:hypothetical protein